MADAAGKELMQRFVKLMKDVNSSESHRPDYNDELRAALLAGGGRARAHAAQWVGRRGLRQARPRPRPPRTPRTSACC
jgi:hypothetical protein